MIERIALQIITGLMNLIVTSFYSMTVGEFKRKHPVGLWEDIVSKEPRFGNIGDNAHITSFDNKLLFAVVNEVACCPDALAIILDKMITEAVKAQVKQTDKQILAHYMVLRKIDSLLPLCAWINKEQRQALSCTVDELIDEHEIEFD